MAVRDNIDRTADHDGRASLGTDLPGKIRMPAQIAFRTQGVKVRVHPLGCADPFRQIRDFRNIALNDVKTDFPEQHRCCFIAKTLAALFVIHIIYAFWLTMQNRAARGSERYAVNVKPKTVEWASQNMLVLGIIVIAGLALHFANFWYKMQFAEIIGVHDLGAFGPTDGAAYIRETFGCPVFTVLYLIWLAALWFHLTHGFWSALQTLGWSNKIWFERWKTIGNIYSTLVVLGFAAVVVIYFVKSLACGAC